MEARKVIPLSIGIVGYGAFGVFLSALAQRCLPEACVFVYSRSRGEDGVLFFPLEEVARADIVFLSAPISAYEDTIRRVVPLLGERSVLVDVATVKTHTVALLEKYAGGKKWIATHPMFGPESFAKKGSLEGLRIVVCGRSLSAEEYSAAVAFLRSSGFDVVEMSAERHDKHLADSLFLTHYVGRIIAAAGFDRTEIDTVSFGFLMDAVESVRHDEALFRDVYRFNPYCKEFIARFERGEEDVRTMLEA